MALSDEPYLFFVGQVGGLLKKDKGVCIFPNFWHKRLKRKNVSCMQV